MKVASVSSDDPYLRVIGFSKSFTSHPDSFVILNRAWFPVETTIHISGTLSESFEVYRTIVDTFPDHFWTADKPELEHYKKLDDTKLEDWEITYTAPPLSVTTFFGK